MAGYSEVVEYCKRFNLAPPTRFKYWIESSSLLIVLLCKVVVGSVSYGSVLALLWLFSGKPESFESEAVYYCGGYLKRGLNS